MSRRYSGRLGTKSTPEINTADTIALTAATNVNNVKLDAASTLMLNEMQSITAVGSSGADTIQAGGTGQTLTGNGADTLIGSSGGSDISSDTSAHLNGVTIKNFPSSDAIDFTNITCAPSDTVTAVASAQQIRRSQSRQARPSPRSPWPVLLRPLASI